MKKRDSLRMVDLGGEGDLGRLKWVIGREGNSEEEDTARVRTVGLYDSLLVFSRFRSGLV